MTKKARQGCEGAGLLPVRARRVPFLFMVAAGGVGERAAPPE